MPYKDPEKRKAVSRASYKKWAKAHPDRVRAHQAAHRAKGSSVNGRQPWTEEEEEAVMTFKGTDVELSRKIGRSVAAIAVRRHRIKRRNI